MIHLCNGTLCNSEKLTLLNNMDEPCKMEQKKPDSQENMLWSTLIKLENRWIINGVSHQLGITLVGGMGGGTRGLAQVGSVIISLGAGYVDILKWWKFKKQCLCFVYFSVYMLIWIRRGFFF